LHLSVLQAQAVKQAMEFLKSASLDLLNFLVEVLDLLVKLLDCSFLVLEILVQSFDHFSCGEPGLNLGDHLRYVEGAECVQLVAEDQSSPVAVNLFECMPQQ